MVGAPTTKEATRRLPSWMLPPPSKDHAAKEGAQSKDQDTRPQPLAAETTKRAVLSKKETLKSNGHIIVERKKRERKRMTFQEEEASDDMLQGTISGSISLDVSGEKVQGTAPWKRRRVKGLLPEDNQESETMSPSSGDVELTVDDLMSIAEEYIKAKKDSELQQPPLGLLGGSLMDVQGSSLSSDTSDQKIPGDEKSTDKCSTTDSNSYKIVVSMESTGDPAQDMLNLFLGPLLKKPTEADKKDTLVPDDMMMQLINKRSQNNVVGDSLPLKKKGSLKEKVAMFFE